MVFHARRSTVSSYASGAVIGVVFAFAIDGLTVVITICGGGRCVICGDCARSGAAKEKVFG